MEKLDILIIQNSFKSARKEVETVLSLKKIKKTHTLCTIYFKLRVEIIDAMDVSVLAKLLQTSHLTVSYHCDCQK